MLLPGKSDVWSPPKEDEAGCSSDTSSWIEVMLGVRCCRVVGASRELGQELLARLARPELDRPVLGPAGQTAVREEREGPDVVG